MFPKVMGKENHPIPPEEQLHLLPSVLLHTGKLCFPKDHRIHLNWMPWVWQEGQSSTFSYSVLTGELINPINLLKLNEQHGGWQGRNSLWDATGCGVGGKDFL